MNNKDAMNVYGKEAAKVFKQLRELGAISISHHRSDVIDIQVTAKAIADLDVDCNIEQLSPNVRGYGKDYHLDAKFDHFRLIAVADEDEKQSLFPEKEVVSQ